MIVVLLSLIESLLWIPGILLNVEVMREFGPMRESW